VISQGVWILWRSKIAISHWQSQSPLTQGWRYRAARDNVCVNVNRLNWCDHGLRGSASPVLTATGFINGRWQFSTPHRIHTQRPITKKFVASDYVGDPYGCAKFGANPSTGGIWANGWNITKFFLFIPFFYELTYRSDATRDFYTWWLKRRGFAQGCAFSGVSLTLLPILGVKYPQNPNFYAEGRKITHA